MKNILIILILTIPVIVFLGCTKPEVNLNCVTDACELETCIDNLNEVCDFREALGSNHERYDTLRQKAETLDQRYFDHTCEWECDREAQTKCHIFCIKKGVEYDSYVNLLAM